MTKNIHIHIHGRVNDAEKTGSWTIAARESTAANRFIEFAQTKGELTREQAIKAYQKYKSVKAIKIDATMGQFSFTHGGFAERDVLRRAAGLDE